MRYSPRVRRLNAREDLQQRGFTTTVDADDTDTITGLNTERDPVQEGLESKGLAYIFQVDEVRHNAFILVGGSIN